MADPRTHAALLEPGRRFHGLSAALVVALAGACGGSSGGEAPVLEQDGSRVVVEVLNATDRPGLARRATRALRAAGIDVVFYGTAESTVDSTRILVRRGDEGVGARVARALGVGRVRSAPDTLRRVDVTVLLGPDFVPPPDPRP